jgi:hypothetical protein
VQERRQNLSPWALELTKIVMRQAFFVVEAGGDEFWRASRAK